MSFSMRCSVNSQSSSSYEDRMRQPHTPTEKNKNPLESVAKTISADCRSSSSSSSLVGRVQRSPSPEPTRPQKKVCSAASAVAGSHFAASPVHDDVALWDSVLEACCRGEQHVLDRYKNAPESFWLGLRDDEERTVLHLAVKHGHQALAQWLMERCPRLMYVEDRLGNLPGDLSKDHRFVLCLLDCLIPRGTKPSINVSKDLEQLAFLCRLKDKTLPLNYCEQILLRGTKKHQAQTAMKIPELLRPHSSETHPFEVCAKLGKEELAVELIQMIESRLSGKNQIRPFFIACISGAKTLTSLLFKNGHGRDKEELCNKFLFERLQDNQVTSQLIPFNYKGARFLTTTQLELAWFLTLGLKEEAKALLKVRIKAFLEEDKNQTFKFTATEMQIFLCLLTHRSHPLTKEIMNDFKHSDKHEYLKSLIEIVKIVRNEYKRAFAILDELKKAITYELQGRLEENSTDFVELEKEYALVSMLLFLDCESLARQVFKCYNQSISKRGISIISPLLKGLFKFNRDNSEGWAFFRKLVEMAKDQEINCSLTGDRTAQSIVHYLAQSRAENTVEILEWLDETFPREARWLAGQSDPEFYGYALENTLTKQKKDFSVAGQQQKLVEKLLKMTGRESLEIIIQRACKEVKLKTLLLLAGSVEVHRAVDLASLHWSDADMEKTLRSLPAPIMLTKDGVQALLRILLAQRRGDGSHAAKMPWLEPKHLKSLLVYILAVVEEPKDLTMMNSFLELRLANPEAFQNFFSPEEFFLREIVSATLREWKDTKPSEKQQDAMIQALKELIKKIGLPINPRRQGWINFSDVLAPKVWYWWVTEYTRYYPATSARFKEYKRLNPDYNEMINHLRKECTEGFNRDGVKISKAIYSFEERGHTCEISLINNYSFKITMGTWNNRGYYTYQGIRREIKEQVDRLEQQEEWATIQEKVPEQYWIDNRAKPVTNPNDFNRPNGLIPDVLFQRCTTLNEGIIAYRIDPKTGTVEKDEIRPDPFNLENFCSLEKKLKAYINETTARVAIHIEALRCSGVPVIYPATNDEIKHRLGSMSIEAAISGGKCVLFVDPIGRKTAFFGIFPRSHPIDSSDAIQKSTTGIATVEQAQSWQAEFTAKNEARQRKVEEFSALKGIFLQPPIFLEEKKIFCEYYRIAATHLNRHHSHEKIAVLSLPPENKNMMVVAFASLEPKKNFGMVCPKGQLIDKSRELLAISGAIGDYQFHPSYQQIKFETFHDVIHEQPADIDLDEVIKYFDREYVKKYPQAADRKRALELFIANIKAGKGIPGTDPQKNAQDYRRIKIQLTHTLVKLRGEKQAEKLESLVGNLVKMASFCSMGVGTEIQLHYQLAFGLLDQINQNKDAHESMFHEEPIEAVLQCQYKNALSETINMFCVNVLNERSRLQTVHVKKYLRNTLQEIGFPVPPDPQELNTNDAFAIDYSKDFPREHLEHLFTVFLLPTMVKNVMEYQRTALREKKYNNVNGLLGALYTSIQKLNLLELQTRLDIKKMEDERDSKIHALISQIDKLKKELAQVKSNEIWKQIEEAKKQRQSLEKSIQDNALKALHLTDTRKGLERQLTSNEPYQDSEEPRAKKRKVEVARGFNGSFREDICKARIDALGKQIQHLQTIEETFARQKEELSQRVKGLENQVHDSIILEKELAELTKKRGDVAVKYAQKIHTLIEEKAEELQYTRMDPDLMISQLTYKGSIILLEAFSYLQPSEQEKERRRQNEEMFQIMLTPPLQVMLNSSPIEMEDDEEPGNWRLPDDFASHVGNVSPLANNDFNELFMKDEEKL